MINTIKLYWVQLSKRERRVVSIALLIITLGVTYAQVLLPLHRQYKNAANAVKAEYELLNWVIDKANLISQVQPRIAIQDHSDILVNKESLVEMLTNLAEKYQIQVLGIQQLNTGTLSVELAPASFAHLIELLTALQDASVVINKLSVVRGDEPGIVKTRQLILSK